MLFLQMNVATATSDMISVQEKVNGQEVAVSGCNKKLTDAQLRLDTYDSKINALEQTLDRDGGLQTGNG